MIITMIQNKGGSGGKPIDSAVITLDSNTLTYNGEVQYKNVASVVLGGTTLIKGTDYIVEDNFAVNTGSHTLNVVGIGSYSGVATANWSIAKGTPTISIDKDAIELNYMNPSDTITITTNSDGNISVTSSDTDVCTVSVIDNIVTVTMVNDGNATVSIRVQSSNNYNISEIVTCSIEAIPIHIYGVSWDKTSTTTLTRTDDSVNFTDPIPCLSGGAGSSPFDECMPWSGMVKKTFADGNVMVKIPKFWYKWTNETNSLKLQIADGPAEGFYVSPAHADRSDGKGERNYVYIGRYHCDSSYKSRSGVKPIANITCSAARSGCTALGTGYYQLDYAMLWTIRMLYLVEFADWDSQKVIGYGCGDNSSTHYSGQSNTAEYHTGSMQSSRTTYGPGIQYRYIEDPWGNVSDWCDGIAYKSYIYVSNKINSYNDTYSGYKNVGSPTGSFTSYHCISDWGIPSSSSYEWAAYPKIAVRDSTYTTYIADYVGTSSYSRTYLIGVCGDYTQSRGCGLFHMGMALESTSAGEGIGARLQYLP